MGRFEKRRAEFEKKGATIVAISIDPVEKSKAVVERRGLGFPICADPGCEVAKAYGTYDPEHKVALPSVFVLTKDGKVAWRKTGESVPDRPPEDEVLRAVPAP